MCVYEIVEFLYISSFSVVIIFKILVGLGFIIMGFYELE